MNPPRTAPGEGGLGLEPVRPLAVKERVVRQLTGLIENGTLGPGDRLPSERELCERLEVSRGTVREAVQFLQAIGLVEIRHGSGTFVRMAGADQGGLRDEWRSWTIRHADRVHDLLELRKGLEPYAAELAARRAGAAGTAAMEDAVAQMRAAMEPADATSLVQADVAFHHALCAAGGNGALAEFADMIGEQLLRERGTTWTLPGRPDRSLAEHTAILEAVRSGDVEAARRTVLEHLTSVEDDLAASVLSPRPHRRS